MDGEINEIPDPVQWDQGMLLTPQHFLELAGRYEMLQQNMAMLQPFNWGVLRFEYDKTRIGGGSVVVRELEAVMPDGTFISAAEEDIEPLTLDKSQHATQSVYLAIPAQRNFSWNGSAARYQLSRARKGGAGAIPRLRPILHLRNELPPPRFVSIPLLRLEFTTEFVNRFEPPWIAVPRSSEVFTLCSGVASLIRGKIGFLTAQINSPGQSLTGVPELRDRLRNLVSGLPVLEALLHAGQCHPFALYTSLCSIAGHVSLMARDLTPPSFQPYNHCDLLTCFGEVADFIDAAINYGVSEHWSPFRFSVSKEGFRLEPVAALAHYKISEMRWPSLVIGLRVGAGQDKRHILEWGERCLIATGDVMTKRENRVRGAGRHLWADPPDLAPPAGVHLFAIDKDDRSLDLEDVLHLVGDSPLPAEALLYVRQSQEWKA